MTDSLTFTETLTVTAENPLLSGHVVYGRPLLPGVGYMDLVLQVLARHGHPMREIELRNLAILAPLVAAPGERVLATVEGRPVRGGGLRIEVRSRRQHDTADVLHATVTANRRTPSSFQERLALPITGADRVTPLTDIYSWCREHELLHSGLMKIDGVVHHRPGDWVAELELGPSYQADAEAFLFHPALFEAGLLGGGVGVGMLHADNDGPGLYLPLVFESFRAAASLGKRCYVRVPADSVRRNDELVRMAVEFYDENGAKVAEVGQFVGKRVRSATALDVRGEPGPAVPPPGPAVAPVAEPSGDAGQDLVAVLRELVAARLGVASDQVDTSVGYYELGLASADLLSLVSELEQRLSLSLSPTVMFEYRTVAELAAWLSESVGDLPVAAPVAEPSHDMPTAIAVLESADGSADPLPVFRAALIDEVSALLKVPAGEVDPAGEFADFGLDWTGLAQLAERLNERLGSDLAADVFSDHRTVDAMAAHLAAAESAHPMLHRTLSDADGTSYEASFDGSEPYLRDHRVRGSRVLPGVAHLELARAAVARALGEEQTGSVRLDGVVWLRPAVCGPDGLTLRVTVRELPGGSCDYAIYSVDAEGARTLCSRGRGTRAEAGARILPSLDDLRTACVDVVYPASQLYDLYAGMGMDYGPSQRSLVEVGVGTDGTGRRQVLARLRLPSADPLAHGQLHPSILDSALQATIGLWLTAPGNDGRPAALALPFALQQLDVAAATPATAYAWIRHQAGSSTDAASARLDITVFDERGRVCVELTGLSTRALPADTENEATPESSYAPTDIAIVGVSGRYPEAADLEEFWHNLRSGRDSIRTIPAERWDHRRYADVGGTATPRWGGFLDGIDRFDPLFFQISPLEADYLDPQERLFLECVHHTLEDAGYTGESLARAAGGAGSTDASSGRVGVFVGVMYQEYQLLGAQAQERGLPVALWGSASTVANRVSYFYDFHGPSMAVDTMCSSSLTAIHLACEAIRSGQCEAAVAGGVNLSPHPNKYLVLSQRRFLSSDGRCRSFGADGDGYVPGEGVGAVLLKPLERAVADGDHIYGVIKGTALNHGGRTSGYSVPTPVGQGDVIATALAASGVDPRSLSYLEAHGTGTALGDPIEIAGLTRGFRQAGGLPEHCAIGSVKSNIGHAESAAGIAAVTKVLLQLQHGELVPSLHSDTLNPHIDFDRTPFRVQQRAETWQRPTLEIGGERRTFPRIAGVSSFGGGGSNAHVVIAEYQPSTPQKAPSAAGRPALLVLSAQSEPQLVEQARRLHARLGELGQEQLPDAAWTLQTGRMALEERLAIAADSLESARARLEAFVAAPERPGPWVRGTARPGHATNGEALNAAVSDWSERGTPDRLLRLWADGAAVEWETMHSAAAPARRISLPGYPFARERYWVDVETAATVAPALPAGRPEAALLPDGPADRDEMLLLRPVWEESKAMPSGDPGPTATGSAFADHHVMVIGRLADGERDALRAGLPAGVSCRFVEPANGPLDHQYTEVAQDVFGVVREVLEAGVRQPTLFQVVLVGAAGTVAERERLACFGGLTGLLKSARLENPLLHTQYLECLDGVPAAAVARRLTLDAVLDPEPAVRHRDGRRYVGRLDEITCARPATPWREDGVYLITGGAGGLGLIVAQEIAASVGHATVVLTGRSPLDERRRNSLQTLRTAGLTVDYQRADVADRASVERLLTHVADNHGALTGILHAAGVIDDNFVLRKSPEELARVLAPKVAGLVNLDDLSRDQPLDVFACFSSLSGAFGNPGQSDYAAANAFMDGYAAYRNHLVAEGLRSGRTVSVGWPLWDEGGMGADDVVRESLRAAGLAPLDTARGLAALRHALAGEDNGLTDGRLLVLTGRRSHWLPKLTGRGTDARAGRLEPDHGEPATAPDPATAPGPGGIEARSLEERAVRHLRRLLANALKVRPERLDVDTPLERYGMDSVLAVELVSRLEESFGPLSRTLLFEVQTVRALARYFEADHVGSLRTLLGEPEATEPVPPAPVATAARPAPRTPVPAAARPEPDRPSRGQDIAIIGISGRYPQAEGLDEFWAGLRDGKDFVTEIPTDRPELEPLRPSGADARRWGAFLDGVDRFDPLLFGISPREAAAMDPQQRLFLETVWELLEQSGVTQQALENRYGRRVGVYVGAAYRMYQADSSDPVLAALTSSASYNLIANRVSHFFGLEGPSLAVDSMCTSSAMAVHLACADLQRGEAELAVAGGVNLTVHPDKYLALEEMQLLGSHPGSRSFRDGDGYLPAEAVGAVLLKPLDAALRDGDTIHAVIKGTASMHAGRSNGFMTPSHRTQVAVLRRALEKAGTPASSIGYVEAAANGTAFADEVELRALREVFDGVTEPVAVGTVKSNLGHPEAASGIAQLTKVVMQLRHGEVAPLAEVGSANPNLDLDGTPLWLCDRLTDWGPRTALGEDGRPLPRRALVNSAAAGGSHVSLVLEAPPQTEVAAPAAEPAGRQLVVLSARSPERLRRAAQRLLEVLERDASVSLADLAYTSQLGREALPERLALVAESLEELEHALGHHLAAGPAGPAGADPGVPVHRGNIEEDTGPLGTALIGSRGEAFLAGLVADRELEHLAELWVRGADVPWHGLHDGRRRLLPYPATVFEQGRYWVGRSPETPSPAEPAAVPDDGARSGSARGPQLGDTERLMAAAWSEVLQIDAEHLRASSDFFSLGGNSLLATRLINLLKQQVGVELPVQAVFDSPRLDEMAAELERNVPEAVSGDAVDLDRILEGIDLIERLSDEELDALANEN